MGNYLDEPLAMARMPDSKPWRGSAGGAGRIRHDFAVSTTPPRLGIVDYANVAPLVEGLPGSWPIVRAVPSRIADLLAAGEIDLAILPTIELARGRGFVAHRGLGIAADGRCDSVLLFSRVPLRDVRRVALDAASRTSVALTRVLLDREGARDVEWSTREGGGVSERLAGVDATLVIGDPALRAVIPAGVDVHDLATLWRRHLDLPFVFACWTSREGFELTPAVAAELDAAATRGLHGIDELSRREGERTGLPAARMASYLRLLQYRLDERHEKAVKVFFDEARRVGAVEAAATLGAPA